VPALAGHPGTPRKPVVEVRRSQRRRRTVSAYRDGERVVVLIPAQFSGAEEREWVDKMVARLAAREQLRRGRDVVAADERHRGPDDHVEHEIAERADEHGARRY